MDRLTNVLVQVNSLSLGGTQINAVDLAARLQDMGYESTLIGPADTLPPQGESLYDIARDRGVSLNQFDRPTSTISGARLFARRAASSKAEIVHVYGSGNCRSAYWGPCALGRRPLVHTIYEMDVPQHTHRGPELVIGTRYLYEELVGTRRGGVHLISPPVDVERDDPARFPAVAIDNFRYAEGGTAEIVVVIVSRLDEDMKALSIERVMEGIGRINDPRVSLVIVGAGDGEKRLRQIADGVNHRLKNRSIRFIGPMADPRIAYTSADVVVGMGGSAARGLAFGKPLIVSGEFGWFKLFTPATAAELFRSSFWSPVRASDPAEQFVTALRPLLAERDYRRQLGGFGREFAVREFGLDTMAMRLRDVYRSAMSYGPKSWFYDVPVEAGFVRDRVHKGAKRPEATRLGISYDS